MDKTTSKLHDFLQGFRSAFDLTGRTYVDIDIDDLANGWAKDGAALHGDWVNIGNDLRKAMGQVSSGH